jgi:inhibitor of KinA
MRQRKSQRQGRKAGGGAPRARLASAGEQGLVVELGDRIDPAVNARVRWLARTVSERIRDGVVEVVPTYRSLLVVHDPLRLPRARLASRVEALLEEMPEEPAASVGRQVRVPACYGAEHGPDLEAVARLHGMAPDEVVELHSSAAYVVYMLGFTPGFPYLGGLPDRLATPRLDVPRPVVAAGSVAIAGVQAGIYPVASPGGWRILARTPLRLFDPGSRSPFLFAPGDQVRFEPITRERFDEISAATAAGAYHPAASAVEDSP